MGRFILPGCHSYSLGQFDNNRQKSNSIKWIVSLNVPTSQQCIFSVRLNCHILDVAASNHTISHRQDITLPCHQLLASPNISWPCKKNGKIVLRINLLTQVCRATNCLHLPILAGLAKSMVRLCWESIFWHRFSLTIFWLNWYFHILHMICGLETHRPFFAPLLQPPSRIPYNRAATRLDLNLLLLKIYIFAIIATAPFHKKIHYDSQTKFTKWPLKKNLIWTRELTAKKGCQNHRCPNHNSHKCSAQSDLVRGSCHVMSCHVKLS